MQNWAKTTTNMFLSTSGLVVIVLKSDESHGNLYTWVMCTLVIRLCMNLLQNLLVTK